MSGHRFERITEDIKRELTAIFRELKDPRITQTMLSIVKVELSRDLSFCRVYVSAMDGIKKANEAILGLKSASGHIRHELGIRLKLRHVPSLVFIATDSIEYGTEIFKKLDNLRNNNL